MSISRKDENSLAGFVIFCDRKVIRVRANVSSERSPRRGAEIDDDQRSSSNGVGRDPQNRPLRPIGEGSRKIIRRCTSQTALPARSKRLWSMYSGPRKTFANFFAAAKLLRV